MASNGGSGGTETLPLPLSPEDMPEDWRCLAESDATPPLQTTAGARVSYVVPIVDFATQLNQTPVLVPDVQVTVCENAACTPNEQPQAMVFQNPENPILWVVNVPVGYEIHLRVTAEGYIPSDYYPGGPIVGLPPDWNTGMVIGQPITMLRDEALAALYRQIGLPEVDQNRGILAVRTLKCGREEGQARRAADVRIELVTGLPPEPAEPPQGAVPWVLSTGSSAISDDVATDVRGAAGLANLPAQTYRVRGIAPVGPEGTLYSSVALAPVRGGVITVVEARDGWGVWGQ